MNLFFWKISSSQLRFRIINWELSYNTKSQLAWWIEKYVFIIKKYFQRIFYFFVLKHVNSQKNLACGAISRNSRQKLPLQQNPPCVATIWDLCREKNFQRRRRNFLGFELKLSENLINISKKLKHVNISRGKCHEMRGFPTFDQCHFAMS